MSKNLLKYLVIILLLLVPVPGSSQPDERDMEPPPDERSMHEYKREPGQFKRTRYGLIDPTPDVISLKFLPVDDYGFVDWSKALREGMISPQGSVPTPGEAASDEKKPRRVNDVLMKSKMDFMPDVLFPHAPHTRWLECSNCHPKIFKEKAGATPVSMTGIWKGEFCGRCHDHVAFPIRNCFKCHSVKKKEAKR